MFKKEKINTLEKIASLLWSSYQHMYDIRLTNAQNKANFLLVAISFLSVISITLFIYFKDLLFLIPFFLQSISLVILLKTFFIKKEIVIHWFKSEELFKNLERGVFYQDLFADLKTLEGYTSTRHHELLKIINLSLYFLLFSLGTLVLTLLFIYFKNETLFFLVLILAILLILIVFEYYLKQPIFSYSSDKNKEIKNINDWLNKK